MVNWNTASAICIGLCPTCHLARLYSVQQGLDLRAYGKVFYENLLMYKFILNIQLINFFSFCGINKTVLTKEANG